PPRALSGRTMTSMRMLVRLVGGDPRACAIGIAGFTLAGWSVGMVPAANWLGLHHVSVKGADWFVLAWAAGTRAAFLLCLVSLFREKAKLPALAGLLVLGLGEGYGSPLSALRDSCIRWIEGALVAALVVIVSRELLVRRRRRSPPYSGDAAVK